MRAAVFLFLAAPAAALSIGLKRGSAVRIEERPAAWTAAAGAPAGARSVLVRQDPDTSHREELWRVVAGWRWSEHVEKSSVVIVVVSGKLRVRAGTISRDLRAGGTAVLPAGTPFELAARTWFRDTRFVLSRAPAPQ
ncbi:MAG: hypothetical protein KGL53_05020 [Elusimicrobia bacterium]|nr:hypothetical protein [Elusimicrobiota bacterium]